MMDKKLDPKKKINLKEHKLLCIFISLLLLVVLPGCSNNKETVIKASEIIEPSKEEKLPDTSEEIVSSKQVTVENKPEKKSENLLTLTTAELTRRYREAKENSKFDHFEDVYMNMAVQISGYKKSVVFVANPEIVTGYIVSDPSNNSGEWAIELIFSSDDELNFYNSLEDYSEVTVKGIISKIGYTGPYIVVTVNEIRS